MGQHKLIGEQTCRNCKHRGIIPEYGDQPLCLEGPATVTALLVPRHDGTPGVEMTRDVAFPPALDHWHCGRWKPRFERV